VSSVLLEALLAVTLQLFRLAPNPEPPSPSIIEAIADTPAIAAFAIPVIVPKLPANGIGIFAIPFDNSPT